MWVFFQPPLRKPQQHLREQPQQVGSWFFFFKSHSAFEFQTKHTVQNFSKVQLLWPIICFSATETTTVTPPTTPSSTTGKLQFYVMSQHVNRRMCSWIMSSLILKVSRYNYMGLWKMSSLILLVSLYYGTMKNEFLILLVSLYIFGIMKNKFPYPIIITIYMGL